MGIKYLYYLNKVFKSYQFALEIVLRYRVMKSGFPYCNGFTVLDSENIKKNQ
jgi:hypothetical protein